MSSYNIGDLVEFEYRNRRGQGEILNTEKNAQGFLVKVRVSVERFREEIPPYEGQVSLKRWLNVARKMSAWIPVEDVKGKLDHLVEVVA
ncbi:hypothetical protein GQ53DRAFT_826542 [Thozetella sp. PMI_491]|nr:hypothetical protein GQ53DRAFT_826542 [Thozetella sp. PMI_491]